ncbi:MAG: PAS domain-containing protein [Anaerolineales bacterium]|nr:PAS domain-containing protein [Anaerolineales bacterium]
MVNRQFFESIPQPRFKPGLPEIEGMLELYPDATFLIDYSNWRILTANAKAVELVSYTRSELQRIKLPALFKDWEDNRLIIQPGSDAESNRLTLSPRNKTSIEVRVRLIHISSSGKWALLRIIPCGVLQQRELEQQSTIRLADGVKKISQALQKTSLEEALQTILSAAQAISGAIFLSIYQANGKDLELCQVAQIGPPDILPEKLPAQDLGHLRTPTHWVPGKRPLASIHQSARNAGFSSLATVPIGQSHALIGLLIVGSNNSLITETSLPYLQLLGDAINAIIQYFSHTTNLETALENQRFSEIIQSTVINSIPDGIIIVAPDLMIKSINPAAERILGYTQEEAQSKPLNQILIGKDNLSDPLALALDGVPSTNLEDLRFYHRSGAGFPAKISTFPVMVDDMVENIVILIQDMSQQEQLLAHTQALEKRAALGEITAIFAHEVRNPINGISTGLQLMAYNQNKDDPNSELINRMQQDCDRLAELMRTVLSYSRPYEYELETIDVGQLLSRILDRNQPRLASANIQQNFQTEKETNLIRGNRRALEQVFTNLIDNAILAMKDTGGTLAVKIQAVQPEGQTRMIEASIADTGPGIPKEKLEHIFQPFYSTNPGGTGLGLAISKHIITAHKGVIFPSSYPGCTVFHVQLPEAVQLEKS